MTAQDYPITFPYGITTAPYSASHPHRGDDRACPVGTPIVIEGIVIGLTGNTGFTTGPHLHIQEWSGTYTNTRKPQNAFKPGTVVNIDTTGTQGDGSFGKFITIQASDGWNTSYCHLSQVNVQKGQVITMQPASYEVANIYAQELLFRDMPKTEWEAFHKNKTRDQLFDEFRDAKEREDKLAYWKNLENGTKPTVLVKGIYEVKN